MKTNRLHDKTFRKKIKACLAQLKKMLYQTGISAKQKELLNNILDEKKQDIPQSENASNVEVKNLWGQRDLSCLLRERDDRIYHLENELEDLKASNARLAEERKRIKVETMVQSSTSTLEKLIETKNKEIGELTNAIEDLKARNVDLEARLHNEKSAGEILKETNRRLGEINNKKPSPLYNRDFIIELQKSVDLEQELAKYKSLNVDLEKDLSISAENKKSLNERIGILEKMLSAYEMRLKTHDHRKESIDDVPMNGTENELLEELESITAAYDHIVDSNKKLEAAHSGALKRCTELQNENITLKSKIKGYEDAKQFVEKEKRRLEEMKKTLIDEIKLFEDRVANYEMQFIEKDKKISDYKILLTKQQSNLEVLETELQILNKTYRSVQNELHDTKNKLKMLYVEHEDVKKIRDVYKELCSSEGNIVEDLERYKKVLRCPLCDTNVKNSVISKCMHTFCQDCLNDRLKARQRKCPNCQVEFNANDIRKIYL